MGCGHCSCGGHRHGPGGAGKSGGDAGNKAMWATAAVIAMVLAMVGVAVAFEPPAKGPKPAGDTPAVEKSPPAPEISPYVLAHTARRINGTDESLEVYKGKVVLIVNTASRCGLTPQYEALEKLYREKKDQGLVVLGFPANDFRNQEPGTNAEIAEFCSGKFDVTFPMFEKISVTGKDQHPLYRQLAQQPKPLGSDPGWNFTKFVVDRKGNVVARFEPKVKPDDPEVVKKIDALLAQPG